MNNCKKALVLSLCFVFLTACSALAPQPTATPTATSTPVPTETPTATFTLEPTATLTLTPIPPTATKGVPFLAPPSGTPAAKWEDIPIMAGALAGSGDSSGYTFTIKSTVEAVQKYYEAQLPKLGWNLFASGQGTTSAILLFFMKGTDMLTLSAIPQADGIIYVMILK